jgi:hypothetical protein
VIVATLRLAMTFLFAWGLWRAWWSFRDDRVVLAIVGVGLAVRALAGALMFWVSYLEVPLGTSLQLGNGLWFFALDGTTYYWYAEVAASGGLRAIWNLDPTLPSVTYIQALALTLYLVGFTTAASLALNLGSHLAMCLTVVWLANRMDAARPARLLALASVSLMPSWILWSTQPLKDTFFIALFVVFIVPLVVWLERLRAGRGRLWTPLLAQCAVLYIIAGVRWPFGLMIVVAMALSSAWALLSRPAGRLRAAISVAVGVVLLTQSVAIASEANLPPWVRSVLQPRSFRSAVVAISGAPDQALEIADRRRRGHIAAGGSTEIRAPAQTPSGEAAVGTAGPDGVAAGPATVAHAALSPGRRMFLGAAAMLVPLFLGESFGWIVVDGGRGLLAFAELDTVLLDLVLVLGLGLVGRQWRAGRIPHLAFWFVVLMTVMVALALAYEAGNFGTLFRQRNMVAVGVMLLPLFMVPRESPSGAGRQTSDATART